MAYTPQQRMDRLWELARQDPDCRQCEEEMRHFEFLFREYMDQCPGDRELWAYPVSIHIFFGRLLEVATRELRLPEEK